MISEYTEAIANLPYEEGEEAKAACEVWKKSRALEDQKNVSGRSREEYYHAAGSPHLLDRSHTTSSSFLLLIQGFGDSDMLLRAQTL
jgi:hypothetical protein